ncbi:DUF4142 domain-containing protein [Dinghuibacter silviterrae]|uniref:Putative membrane protein n=1 Tax=Dinghuibacter silviterrae TaxID=1539049 RepID=A0A4R8DJM9_9BACT|nr:DUF4142 domain-containing protein [Dinghuibacter silviterrae]TDW97524.1 putative membrane protein [Dinghuibacter silviterrae]
MKKNFSGVALLLMALVACHGSSGSGDAAAEAPAKQDSSNITGPVSASRGDQDFMSAVAEAGMTEIQASRTAEQMASHPRVKDFATMMVQDHGHWGDELKALAQARNVSLPAAISSSHQAAVNALQKLHEGAFDRHYMAMMVHDHEGAVKDFETAEKTVRDTALLRFLKEKLPMIKMHLDSAMAIGKAL